MRAFRLFECVFGMGNPQAPEAKAVTISSMQANPARVRSMARHALLESLDGGREKTGGAG